MAVEGDQRLRKCLSDCISLIETGIRGVISADQESNDAADPDLMTRTSFQDTNIYSFTIDEDERNSMEAMTVSYTHLTLPTILRV